MSSSLNQIGILEDQQEVMIGKLSKYEQGLKGMISKIENSLSQNPSSQDMKG